MKKSFNKDDLAYTENKNNESKLDGKSSHSFLSSLVSSTKMLEKGEMESIFSQYDKEINEICFYNNLLLKTNMGKNTLCTLVREILSTTDRNRMIIRSSIKKENVEKYERQSRADKKKWHTLVKKQHTFTLLKIMNFIKRMECGDDVSYQEFSELGITRVALEYVVDSFLEITKGYHSLVEDNVYARTQGDMIMLNRTEYAMQDIEYVVGCSRDDLWGVYLEISASAKRIKKLSSKIVSAYSRLVMKLANRFKGITSIEENFSHGCDGVLHALRGYDLREKASFATYAKWWIRNNILFQQKMSSVIAVPHTIWYTLGKIDKLIATEGTYEGEFSREYVDTLRSRANLFRSVSLDAPLNTQNSTGSSGIENFLATASIADTLGSSLGDNTAEAKLEDKQNNYLLMKSLRKMVSNLGDNELQPLTFYLLNIGIDPDLISMVFKDRLFSDEDIIKEIENQLT